ncbi:MAG: hypothetical protein AAGE01_15975 [Pseudomonadota bacterium]
MIPPTPRMMVPREALLALLACTTFSVCAQTTTVPLTLAPDGDARFFEYFSGIFAQLDQGFNGNPDLDGFYLIANWEASGGTTYQGVGSGFDVFLVQDPCPGTGCAEDLWVNLGMLTYAGSGDGTFPVTGLDIEFDDVITGRALVTASPYVTVVGTPSGTVTVAGGAVTDLELSTVITFVIDGSAFGEEEVPFVGTFEIDNDRFILAVDDTAMPAAGEYRLVWDVEGGVVAGSPEETFSINAGLTGAWFDPATAGQGVLLEPIPDSASFFGAWFTFDEASAKLGALEQAWFTLQGTYEGSRADLQIFANSGGVFNAPDPVTTEPVGTAVIDFQSCTGASFEYNFDGGPSGMIELTRLTPDTLCDAAADSSPSSAPNQESTP